MLKAAKEPHLAPKILIFVSTKEAAVKVYQLLVHLAQHKDSVSTFHASLTAGTKTLLVELFRSQHSWLHVLVATIAFGMARVLNI